MRARICLVLAAALLSSPVSAQLKRSTYTHEGLAVKVKVPKGWTEIPLKLDEKWIFAKFLSDKTYLSKDRNRNWEHKPLMRMIVFRDDTKKKDAKASDSADPFTRWRGVPYRGYQDFLKRNVRGYFISQEEAGRVGDVDCTMFEVKVAQATPKLRLITWVFHAPSMDVAVEFEMLEDRYGKISGLATRALKSFRFLDTSETVDAGDASAKRTGRAEWVSDYKSWRKKTATERFKLRREAESLRMKQVRESVLDTWDVAQSKSFLVISHGNKRFIEKSIKSADAFRAWCEKQFGMLSDEYVRQGVLRVCQDSDEYMAYEFRNSSSLHNYALLSESYEIVTHWDSYNGTSGGDTGYMFSTIFDGFIQDKDRDVSIYTPLWFKLGISSYFANARLKGRKLEFRPRDFERQMVRDAARNGTMRSFQQLVSMDEETILASFRAGSLALHSQMTAAVRFIFEQGKRHKPLKSFALRYLRLTSEVAREREKRSRKDRSAAFKTAKTEQEEEQQRKARGAMWRKDREEMLKELTNRAFDLNPKEWAKLEKAFAKFIN